jgi:hypothetical protein
MRLLRRIALTGAVAALTVGTTAATAAAAPTGAKNAQELPASCDGRTVTVVVNSANGKGEGTENNEKGQGNFSPAHVVGTNEVFLPTSFDLLFTFTSPDGQSFTFPDTASHGSGSGDTTCTIDYTQQDPEGTFSIVGTVSGRFVEGRPGSSSKPHPTSSARHTTPKGSTKALGLWSGRPECAGSSMSRGY